MFWLYFSTVTRLNVGDGNKMEETTLKTAEHDEMIEADLKLCGFLIILPPFPRYSTSQTFFFFGVFP